MLQESNTFSPVYTHYEDLAPVFGKAVLERHRGKLTEMGGFLDALDAARIDAAPVCAAWAITANHLRENRGMSVGEAGYYASIPFVLGVGSTWAGGILTDLIGRRANDRSARTIIGLISLSTAALLMSAGVWCPQAGLAALLMGCAAGAVDLYLGAAWSSAIDIGGSPAARWPA